MEFPFLPDLGADYYGGIDNEALYFGLCDTPNSNTNASVAQQISNIKTELIRQNAPVGSCLNDSNLGLTTISAHVSVATKPILTPPALAQSGSHLPESPPDSSSEPPYSPLQNHHGLTLTSRDTYSGNAALPGGSLQDLQNLPTTAGVQFTPPHQQQHQQFGQNLNENNQIGNIGPGLRVKYESGLIINPTSLVPHSIQTQQHHQTQLHQHQHQLQHNDNISNQSQHHAGDTHIDMDPQQANNVQMLYNDNNLLNYDPPPYPGIYSNLPENIVNNVNCPASLGEGRRVEFIGTERPRPSAASTPVHNSRKRKMASQLDFVDAPIIKTDPGIKVSPLRSMDTAKRNDLISTPAHGTSVCHSPALSTLIHDNSMDAPSNTDPNDPNGLSRSIAFDAFQPHSCHKLLDQSLHEISILHYQIDADKGFNFSVSDDSFVCQKKNHFQITCHAKLKSEAKFVSTPSGCEKIKSFYLHFYGVKLDAPNQIIRVEQSQSDRSKKEFHPVLIDLQSRIENKITVGRLHFAETTHNNMRKKGRPNPDQRYFQLVVALHAHTVLNDYPVVRVASERIIVRASNPGQFESDVDPTWQKGVALDSIFHAGRVGINTDRPDESLVVHGNLRISGHIVQPSDSRVKHELGQLNTSEQLRNVLKIRIVRYSYDPQFALHSGLKGSNEQSSMSIKDIGVIAQEVKEVIPEAVHEAGSVVLPNGKVIDKLLLVNKDRILMENIGATQELGKVTESLDKRVVHLDEATESLDNRVVHLDNRVIHLERGWIFLVLMLALCLTAVTTLYFVERDKHFEAIQNIRSVLDSKHFRDNGTHHTYHRMTNHPLMILTLPNSTSQPWINHSSEFHPPLAEATENKAKDLKKYGNLKTQHHVTTTAPPSNKGPNKPKPEKSVNKPLQNGSFKPRLESNISQRITATESSAEKVIDSVPLTQGFENNSIDSESQQGAKTKTVTAIKSTDNNSLSSFQSTKWPKNESKTEDIGQHLNEHPALNDGPNNSNYKQTEPITIPSYIFSSVTTISQIDALTSKTLDPLKDVVIKKNGNYTYVTPPTSNNSKGVVDNTLDNQDPAEFHDLNHQNISKDHSAYDPIYKYKEKSALERRSASTETSIEWSILPSMHEEIFGESEECSKTSRKINCLSTCQDEEIKTKPLSLDGTPEFPEHKEPLDQVNQQNIDGELTYKSQEDIDDEIVESKQKNYEIGKNSYPAQALSKQPADEQQPEETETIELNDHEISEEPSGDTKILAKISEQETSSILSNDCAKILGNLKATKMNRTFDLDLDYCAFDEKLLQKTYVIPISPYLITETLDLQLSSSKALNWFLCSSNVKDPLQKPYLQDSNSNKDIIEGAIQRNFANFIFDIPKRGAFEQQIVVRITNQTQTVNICSEAPLATNTILQYNFKLKRDCD